MLLLLLRLGIVLRVLLLLVVVVVAHVCGLLVSLLLLLLLAVADIRVVLVRVKVYGGGLRLHHDRLAIGNHHRGALKFSCDL